MGSQIRAGHPHAPTRVVLSPAKDLRLPATPSPKAKAHSMPIAQDPSLPLVAQDDTKRDAQNHCVVLSFVLSEAEAETKDPGLPTPNRPYLLEHSATESKTLNHSGYSFGSNTSSRHDCAWRRARIAL